MRSRDLKINGYVVGQTPNPPLAVALVAGLAGLVAEDGTTLELGARSLFYVALAIWAWGEAADGVNLFRRALGTAALIFIVVRVAQGFE